MVKFVRNPSNDLEAFQKAVTEKTRAFYAESIGKPYGKLNRERSNAILVCHALSGDANSCCRLFEGGENPRMVGQHDRPANHYFRKGL
jgi:homoserine acetyltransferase